ncbi:MAG TPA: PHP domain-containing protein [Ktedonobacterales bacterium]|nr:PHP domain-containing protein [Ktedonobacterales bacterium]
MSALIDLHLHTTYSDGHWAPRALFDQLMERDVAIAAVMDHDQLDHLPEVLALGAERGIIVIPGTEVTARWRETAAHILCYAPPATGFSGDALRRVVERIRAAMLVNTTMIYRAIRQRGYDFPRQGEILAAQGGRPIRARDVARLLLESGHVATPAEAMALVIEAGYRQATAPLAEVVEAAHASGALCLLAHPGRGEGEIHRFDPEEIEAILRDVSLDGVEAHYPTHSDEQVAAYTALARRHDLLISAGSDSHGPRQRLPIAYLPAYADALLARLGLAAG